VSDINHLHVLQYEEGNVDISVPDFSIQHGVDLTHFTNKIRLGIPTVEIQEALVLRKSSTSTERRSCLDACSVICYATWV
jgi:hypothetical protein